jgi:hypothetical protein
VYGPILREKRLSYGHGDSVVMLSAILLCIGWCPPPLRPCIIKPSLSPDAPVSYHSTRPNGSKAEVTSVRRLTEESFSSFPPA